jgi:hypothetical protein
MQKLVNSCNNLISITINRNNGTLQADEWCRRLFSPREMSIDMLSYQSSDDDDADDY